MNLLPEIPRFAKHWNLVLDGPPIETPCAVVAFGWRHIEPVALKVFNPATCEDGGAAALTHFNGRGSVRLLDRFENALLLERALAGESLTSRVLSGRDDEATSILCSVMGRLHAIGPAATDQFATVQVWGEAFERSRELAKAYISANWLDRAQGLHQELAASQDSHVLLHGDLHHDNVVRDAVRGWVAIDPMGVLGEPAYETGAALRNPTLDVGLYAQPAIIGRRARVFSERLGLDLKRVLGWCFAQAVLSAIWSLEDGLGVPGAARGLAVAGATLPLL